MRTLVIVAALGAFVGAQQASGPYEVKYKHEASLKKIPGVQDVAVGGANGELRIVVRVDDAAARDAVRSYCGGERLDGTPVHVLVAGPARSCASCPVHCRASGPGQTVAEAALKTSPGQTRIDLDRLDDPRYARERCDVIRKWLGLPKLADVKVPCLEMVSWSNDPEKIRWVVAQDIPHWPSKEMPGLRGSDVNTLACPTHGTHIGGEVICYTWVKHRQFCPLGMKQVLKTLDRMTPRPGY